MAHIKVLARHALIGTALMGIFGSMSVIAYEAAGAAISLTSYVSPAR